MRKRQRKAAAYPIGQAAVESGGGTHSVNLVDLGSSITRQPVMRLAQNHHRSPGGSFTRVVRAIFRSQFLTCTMVKPAAHLSQVQTAPMWVKIR